MNIEVHPRVFERHPELTREDVKSAVVNALRSQDRLGTDPLEYVGVGPDTAGRPVQWVAIRLEGVDSWYVFHAMRATRKVLSELGMGR